MNDLVDSPAETKYGGDNHDHQGDTPAHLHDALCIEDKSPIMIYVVVSSSTLLFQRHLPVIGLIPQSIASLCFKRRKEPYMYTQPI